MCLTGFFYVTDSPDTIQYVTITKVSLLQSCMNTNSKTLPPAATIHTPAEPIRSPITRSRSAVRKDHAKPRTPCTQSRALDISSRQDEGPAPSTARFRAGRSAADLSSASDASGEHKHAGCGSVERAQRVCEAGYAAQGWWRLCWASGSKAGRSISKCVCPPPGAREISCSSSSSSKSEARLQPDHHAKLEQSSATL